MIVWIPALSKQCTIESPSHSLSLSLSPSLFLSPLPLSLSLLDDRDQLGDLLTRLFEEPSHSSSVPDEPTTPETFDQQQLTVNFSNALRQLMT